MKIEILTDDMHWLNLYSQINPMMGSQLDFYRGKRTESVNGLTNRNPLLPSKTLEKIFEN
jgi:hypothetical protein